MSESQINKISGLVITFNEVNNIEEIIQNLNFVDELIIVDSYSTDGTIDLIKKHPKVKLLLNKFDNFSSQRNLAIENASHPWILFLDADERICDNLKKEILETINKAQTYNSYYFFRKFMFQNSHLKFSGWQTDKNIRLFKKGTAEYISDKLVHEKLNVTGEIGVLKHQLIHYSYTNFKSYKTKMIYYGTLKAQELYRKGVKPNLFHFYVKPAYKFLHSYLIRLGILDGKKGIIISYLNALSIYVRYPELKKLYKK